jgi:hypothetical protein
MTKLTNTQFWLVVAAILVVMAILGWIVGVYMKKSNSTCLMYAGISVLIGVAVSAALYFTIGPKSGDSPKLPGLNRETFLSDMANA